MSRRILITISLTLGSLIGSGFAVAESAEAPRPNIILIMADDVGFSDLGCYGGELTTPNLDALAAQGVRFTQFYNGARCCPTRAALLTGLYAHQAGMGHMTTADRGFDGYRGVLNRESVTIAEALRPAGYRTYMTGKWHVTSSAGPNGNRATWPLGRGFEKYYGIIGGAANYFDPGTLCRQDKPISAFDDPEYKPESYYFTDAISDNAVKYLQDNQTESPNKPFFLYMAYTAAHWPMQAPAAAVAKYKGKFDAGYAPVRDARLQRMVASGLLPEAAQMSPIAGDWDKVANKEWEARCKEVYAAMIETMDTGIGRVVAQLKASGQYENTLILFLQDNGACAENTGRTANAAQPPSPLKPMTPQEIQPKSQPPMQTRDGRWIRTGPDVMPGPADTYIAYGRGWANVSNTPFREYKHWTHEGGISTPLIAHWPKGIRADRDGKFERQPSHLIDIMATCVDLAGATYPTVLDGHKIKPKAGVSLRPAFNGESINRPEPIFWEHESNRAVRDGDWKLVAKEDEPWELYDMKADRSELHNLASSQSDRVQSMAAAWDAWAKRSDVLPLGAWKDKSDRLSARMSFDLKKDDHLDRTEAPAIGDRPFAIEARITADESHPNGVIVAQGGAALGYSLFLKGNRPHFVVRTNGTLYQVVGAALTPGEHTLTAHLNADEKLSLGVDGQAAVSAAGKFLAKIPADGLEVGQDDNAAVGNYASPFAFPGVIESVRIKVERH